MCFKTGFKDRERIGVVNVVHESVPKTRGHLAESSEAHDGQVRTRGREEGDVRVQEGVVMRRRSERYGGVRLWRDLKVRRRILKLFRYFTGSQWSNGRNNMFCGEAAQGAPFALYHPSHGPELDKHLIRLMHSVCIYILQCLIVFGDIAIQLWNSPSDCKTKTSLYKYDQLISLRILCDSISRLLPRNIWDMTDRHTSVGLEEIYFRETHKH